MSPFKWLNVWFHAYPTSPILFLLLLDNEFVLTDVVVIFNFLFVEWIFFRKIIIIKGSLSLSFNSTDKLNHHHK